MANLFINEKFDEFLKENSKEKSEKIFENFKIFVKQLKANFKESKISETIETIKIVFPNENYIECSKEEDLAFFFHNLNNFEEVITF